MTTKTIKLKNSPIFSFSFSEALQVFDEKREQILDKIPKCLQLPYHNLSSFIITPGILTVKTLYHLFKSSLYALAFPISCIATVLTLGISKVTRSFPKRSLLKTFEELGNAVLSTFSLILGEVCFLAGTILYSKIPALIIRR